MAGKRTEAGLFGPLLTLEALHVASQRVLWYHATTDLGLQGVRRLQESALLLQCVAT